MAQLPGSYRGCSFLHVCAWSKRFFPPGRPPLASQPGLHRPLADGSQCISSTIPNRPLSSTAQVCSLPPVAPASAVTLAAALGSRCTGILLRKALHGRGGRLPTVAPMCSTEHPTDVPGQGQKHKSASVGPGLLCIRPLQRVSFFFGLRALVHLTAKPRDKIILFSQ